MIKRKVFACVCASLFLSALSFSQDADSDADLFGDDAFFDDENIVELEDSGSGTSGAFGGAGSSGQGQKISSDLAHGVLFETGSVRIGGNFTTSIETYTVLYDGTLEEQNKFGDNVYNTTLSPAADAWLYVDARPSQTLRMYTKFGMNYPYTITASSYPDMEEYYVYGFPLPVTKGVTTTLANCFYVKELFTDFSLYDRAFFRFGLHTVTWGTGLFYSPVSDMINTSSINPEDTDAQVNGSLNLRTQITFPNTQNCLWLYVIPDCVTNTIAYSEYDSTTLAEYLSGVQYPYDARKTAFAAKGDIVLGAWELGAGAFYKFQSAPKGMLTASGSVINGKVSVYGEAVYRYGTDSEWNAEPDSWNEKTNVFQATAGATYIWKTPLITFAAQYYYDGNADDNEYSTKGHNVAGTINFGRIGTTNFTANLLGLFNFGKTAMPENLMDAYTDIIAKGKSFNPYCGIVSGTFSYSPVNELTFSMGPYITWLSWEENPTVAFKLKFTLGGGKF